MPLPIRDVNYDSDPEIQAEKELAKKDPVTYAIDENSLITRKKKESESDVSTTPPNVVAPVQVGKNRTKSADDVSKKPKVGNQTKALKKQRSRGISGCSSRKYSGFDGYDLDDLDYEDDDYDQREVFDECDEQDYTYPKK